MQVILDCQNIDGRRELHFELSKAMNFPEWYGNNLDALHDVLTDIAEETEIVIRNFDVLKERLDVYADRFRNVLLASEDENENLSIIIE